MTLLTIHHFEDEPELVRWIPSTLLNRYWLEHPEWIVDDANYEEVDDEELVRFQLRPTETVTIEYRVYRTEEEFRSRFQRLAKPGDIVLLDVMSERQVGDSQMPFGLAACEIAAPIVGEANICFLTAFPRLIVSKGVRVVAKPPDADAFVTLIASILRVG